MVRSYSLAALGVFALSISVTRPALPQSLPQPQAETQVSPLLSPQPVTQRETYRRSPIQVRVLFTGQLLGHLALPEHQIADPPSKGCPQNSGGDWKKENPREAWFIKEMNRMRGTNPTIVLGMGDNFAPVLYARQFSQAPDSSYRSKDLNTWNWEGGQKGKWIPIKSEKQWIKDVPKQVRSEIEKGRGIIPTDNVGCFIRAAGYDAIVPGVEDFYFGPERLRYLARFLATPGSGTSEKGVHMLASNLVIETSYVERRTPLPKSESKLTYDTEREGLSVQNITDGKPVLPWLQYVEIESKGSGLHEGQLCKYDPEHPEKIGECLSKFQFTSPDSDRADIYRGYFFPKAKELQPGENYALCVPFPQHKPEQKDRFCIRFSVYFPFFSYRDPKAREVTERYTNPEPYVLKELGKGNEVAVFGVVDPNLRSYVGSLNSIWANTDKVYKTEVLVIDPAQALTQQLEYFDRWYKEKHGIRKFEGIKVLLAQMSSPLARQLAATLQGKFNVVLSEAESEQATPNGMVVIEPLAEDPKYHGKEFSRQGTRNAEPSFVAVPPPYFDRSIEQPVRQIRQLDVSYMPASANPRSKHQDGDFKSARWEFGMSGRRTVEPPHWSTPLCEAFVKEELDKKARVTLESLLEKSSDLPIPTDKKGEPCDSVSTASQNPSSVGPDKRKEGFEKHLKSLALFALKRKFNADVALMQRRDFYFGPFPGVDSGSRLPEWIDRILWKGDLAMLVMVKGSTLQALLKKSDQFDDQDKQALSLELRRGRALVRLGVFHDPLRDEYLINGEVLNPDRVYSVATTDFIGAGDTGYPEILKDELGNPALPREFPKTLHMISGLVCDLIKAVADKEASYACPAEFPRGPYLDALTAEPSVKGRWLTAPGQFWNWTQIPYLLSLKHRPRTSRELMSSTREELTVQDRRVWFISHSLSASLTAIYDNVSESQRTSLFSGITSPSQLQAKESHELSIEVKDRLGSSGRRADFYLQPELNYDHVVTSDANGPAVSNFKQNLLAGEVGSFIHRSKDYPRLGMLLSIRDETEFHRPIETVKLSNAEKTTLNFSHARSNKVFGRFGFRTQGRQNYFEGGFQVGEVKRVTAFNFTTATGTISCPFAASEASNEPACLKANSDDSPGKTPSITKDSVPSATLGTALRYGWFSDLKLVVPLDSRLSYEFKNEFEYYYAGKGTISTDMLYRDLWSNSLVFKVTRNFSVAPKFDVFFYENQVEHNAFRQIQPSITLKYVFDWFSGTRWRTALLYMDPKQ